MPPDIRALDSSDVDALQALLEATPDYSEQVTGYPPGPSDALSALIAVPPGYDPAGKRGVGLWADGELTAFGDVLIGYPDPRTAYLGLLIVRGDRRRRGHGRTLHDALLADVRTAGASVVRAGIVDSVEREAAPFLRSLGYEPTGEQKPYRYDHLVSVTRFWELEVG
ncbi:Acetyltransferase (GNAT) domain-containing protein [Curtobacterium sp. 9128]|uniref:GNAT family N-acetyltransferase n=1 Tax=Curtobacterium sp. 9128 TaxID=1793722 RepID=UPI0007D72C0E|nr:GNAT family N-acetyltransferase [Curtobacterium sp. 9128]SBN61592.1 Acetyltransferase (GNAT) domain-containing protein [Curtobacterium sp. 9128]